jgi:hypothetical protein
VKCRPRSARPARPRLLPKEAADGDRTRIIALEGRGSAIELPPREVVSLRALSVAAPECSVRRPIMGRGLHLE